MALTYQNLSLSLSLSVSFSVCLSLSLSPSSQNKCAVGAKLKIITMCHFLYLQGRSLLGLSRFF